MTAPSHQDQILPGIALMLGFCLTAPLLDVAAKLAAQTLEVGQITTARFIVQTSLLVPVLMWMGLPLWLGRKTLLHIVIRAVFLVFSTYFFIAAIAVMPIADALAIVFVEPFILLILGYLIFEDTVGPRRIIASAFGFLGAVLIIQPSLKSFGFVALYPLGTAVFFAGYMLVTRGLSWRLHPVEMHYQTSVAAALICTPFVILGTQFDWPTLRLSEPLGIAWLWLFGVGLFSAISHMMMTFALSMAPSATLAPLHYLEIVSATALGYLIFNDFPDRLTLSGVAIVVGSGLYVVHRERIASRRPIAEG